MWSRSQSEQLASLSRVEAKLMELSVGIQAERWIAEEVWWVMTQC